MNGEDERRVDEHIEVAVARLDAQMRGHWRLDEERFRARDAAALEVAKQLQAFKDLSNEWRGALSDLSETKLSKDAYEPRHSQLEGQIGLTQQDIAEIRAELRESGGIDRGSERTQEQLRANRQLALYALVALVSLVSLAITALTILQ